jgi:hypothetical protein
VPHGLCNGKVLVDEDDLLFFADQSIGGCASTPEPRNEQIHIFDVCADSQSLASILTPDSCLFAVSGQARFWVPRFNRPRNRTGRNCLMILCPYHTA